MRNRKQKASIQSMNNDDLNLQANNEGKGNTHGCRCINYTELYGKSITIENEMHHVGLNRKFKLCPSCLLTGLSLSSKERIYPLTQRTRYMWLPNIQCTIMYMDVLMYNGCIGTYLMQWVSWPALHGQRKRGSISND